MGFLSAKQKVAATATSAKRAAKKAEFFHAHECAVCPLNHAPNLRHPKMPASGSDTPTVYMIGEAPGTNEDRRGKQFVGPAGKVLHFRIPDHWLPRIRYNNVIRTHPPKNQTPTFEMIESCRPSVVADIERTKPRAIFGFGGVPLGWAMRQTHITSWRGRYAPIKVGGHTCWYFPMLHPSYVMRDRKWEPRRKSDYGGSELEFVFARDLSEAFKLVTTLPDPIVHTPEEANENIYCYTGLKSGEFDELIEVIEWTRDNETVIGLDLETNGLRPYRKNSKILSVALSGRDETIALALDHPEARWTKEQRNKIFTSLQHMLWSTKARKVAHNLAFEMEWLAAYFNPTLLWQGKWGDTLSQAYVLDERKSRTKGGAQSLDFLVQLHFGLNLKEVSKTEAYDMSNLESMPLDILLPYNALDAKYHRLLYLTQAKRLKKDGLMDVYTKLHMPRIPATVLTQRAGIPIDQSEVIKLDEEYTDLLAEIEEDIAALPEVKSFRRRNGKPFRPSAPKDIEQVFHKLGIYLDSYKETDLEQVNHELAELIVEWRKANKTLSTYIKPISTGSPHIYDDGRLHPVTSTVLVETSRTSSEQPNYQNIPKRDPEGKRVRKCFRAKPVRGEKIKVVSFDFGQIQARNVAMESKDQSLVKYMWDRHDIHSDWTKRIAAAHPRWIAEGAQKLAKDEALFDHYRNRTKNQIVFPAFFGAGAFKIAAELGIPERVAEGLLRDFWGEFPDIKEWHETIHALYRKHGYVTGLTGYRRRAPISPNQLINAPIQADEAAIVCSAMARLSKLDPDKYQPNMEIHDDLTFFWPESAVDDRAEVVIGEMLHIEFDWINVPIVVDMEIGDNWHDMTRVGEYASDTWNK